MSADHSRDTGTPDRHADELRTPCRDCHGGTASIFGLTQDRLPVLRIYYRVFLDELFGWYVQVSGERLDIAAGHVHAGFSATVGASLAIDLLLHLTSDPAKQMIGNMVRFEKPPKAEVLSRIRFRENADLDEVGDHASSILPPAGGGRSSLRQSTATAPRPVFTAMQRRNLRPRHGPC